MFDLFEEDMSGLVCTASPPIPDTLYKLFYLKGEENDTQVRLAPFATIICNPYHSALQENGPGIIVHELMHLLDIGHPHVLNETNGILTAHWDKFPAGGYSEYLNKVSVHPFLKYGLASPFSIMHYSASGLDPLKKFNETAIDKLLDDNQFSEVLKSDYKALFKSGIVGRAKLMTFQDLLSIVLRLKMIAPKSLIRRPI